MTTTCMKNSAVGDEWIREACRLNPLMRLEDGSFRSGPVRLSYINLLQPRGYKDQTPKYSVDPLFPPFANLSELEAEITRVGAAAYPECLSNGQLYGVALPLRDQGERGNKEGYTPGLKFISAKSDKPVFVGAKPPQNGRVTDPNELYPGIWGVVNFNLYASKSVKRVSIGLNGVKLWQDDTRVGGGGGPSESSIAASFEGMRMGTPVAIPGMTPAPQYQPTPEPTMSADEFMRQMGLA